MLQGPRFGSSLEARHVERGLMLLGWFVVGGVGVGSVSWVDQEVKMKEPGEVEGGAGAEE